MSLKRDPQRDPRPLPRASPPPRGPARFGQAGADRLADAEPRWPGAGAEPAAMVTADHRDPAVTFLHADDHLVGTGMFERVSQRLAHGVADGDLPHFGKCVVVQFGDHWARNPSRAISAA